MSVLDYVALATGYFFLTGIVVMALWILLVEGVHRIRQRRGGAHSRLRLVGAGDPFPASTSPTSRRSATRPLPTRAVKGNLRPASTLVTSPPTDSGTSTSEGSPRADFSKYNWPVA